MDAWGCMEVTFSCRHARITGYLTSTTATSDAATHPCRWLEHRRLFANSRRQLAWPGSLQDLDHAPRIFSCLLTLHEEEFLLLHPCQHVQHGRPLGLILRPLELLLELGNLRSELDKLA